MTPENKPEVMRARDPRHWRSSSSHDVIATLNLKHDSPSALPPSGSWRPFAAVVKLQVAPAQAQPVASLRREPLTSYIQTCPALAHFSRWTVLRLGESDETGGRIPRRNNTVCGQRHVKQGPERPRDTGGGGLAAATAPNVDWPASRRRTRSAASNVVSVMRHGSLRHCNQSRCRVANLHQFCPFLVINPHPSLGRHSTYSRHQAGSHNS